MKTEEERLKSIIDELQFEPFLKYDVRLRITLKGKDAPAEGKEIEARPD